MPNNLFYLALITYWLIFFRHILVNPFVICASEALTYDFGNMIQAGRCWKRSSPPSDPYHFYDFTGLCMGLFYPLNILSACIMSSVKLDTAWKVQVYNLLFHNLLMSFFAYHLFGGGYIGLFGALAWSYGAWHIKQSLWYVQTFCWITATLLFFETHNPIMAGVSLGMLYLSGHIRLFAYFTYLLIPYFIIRHIFPLQSFLIAFAISGYQLYRYYRYAKGNIAMTRTYEEKVKVGRVPLWYYITMFIPFRPNGYMFGVGYQEISFYVTPLIGLFALSSRSHCWLLVVGGIILSGGGKIFKLSQKLMARFPQYWGYFAMLGMVVCGVDGLRQYQLDDKQLILLTLLLSVLLLRNSSLLPIYPLAGWSKKPSKFFETPMLQFLKGKKVNNLPYPVYRGQVNQIYTLGYTGGNHDKELGKILNLPRDGIGEYNYFDYNTDTDKTEELGIEYHIGNKPSNNTKWKKVIGYDNLWQNTHI